MTEESPFQTPATNPEQEEVVVQVNCVSVPMANGVTWVTDGFKIFFTNPFLWALVLFIYTLIIFGLSTMVSILTTIIEPVFTAGFLICASESKYNKTFTVEKLFDGFSRNGLKLCLLGLLELIVMLVFSIGAIAISFMLIANNIDEVDNWDLNNFEQVITSLVDSPELIPILLQIAFIWIAATLLFLVFSIALWFAPALIVFNDVSFFTSLKLSFIAPLKNVLPFLVFSLIYLVISTIAVVPIALLVLFAYEDYANMSSISVLSVGSTIFLIGMIEFFILTPAMTASTFAIYEDIYKVEKE